jgi:hypothetical protein
MLIQINSLLKFLGLSGSWVYTSGNKIGSECNYTWYDGQPLSYVNWNTGDPASANSEECMMMLGGKWSDVFCTAVTYFMCEQVAGETITTTTPCPYSLCTTADCESNVSIIMINMCTSIDLIQNSINQQVQINIFFVVATIKN